MTTWLLGHYPGWRVAVSGAPVTDWLDQYNLGDSNVRRGAGFGGSPWTSPERMKAYVDQSPITYAHKIRTPTLVMTNMGDYRVTPTQAFKLYHALKDNGVDTKFVGYPLPGHNAADPGPPARRAAAVDAVDCGSFRAAEDADQRAGSEVGRAARTARSARGRGRGLHSCVRRGRRVEGLASSLRYRPLRCARGRGAQQEAILRGDRRRNRLRPDAIALPLEPHGAEDVDRDRRLHPARQISRIADREIVTARQNGHAGAGLRGALEDAIRQRPARVARDDDVGGQDRDIVEAVRDEGDSAGQAWPGPGELVADFRGRGRQRPVDDERLR